MSECIRINSIEHLPIESTLLIHYTVLCTGFWDLNQMATAYRNICDEEWTVMYPNFQHPRHTDFPLDIPVAGYRGVFAWNYDGVYGVSAENFDEAHSYLLQLSIFNFNCLYTGAAPTGTNSNTGALPKEILDTTTPPPPIIPITVPPPIIPPRIPDPPVPGPPRPPALPRDVPFDTRTPRPNPPDFPIPPATSPRPTATTIPPTTPRDNPTTTIPPRTIGVTTIDSIITNPNTNQPDRPNQSIPGAILPNRFINNITTRNDVIVSPPSVPNNQVQPIGSKGIDLNDQGSAGNTSSLPGLQSNISPPIYPTSSTNTKSVRQIDTSSLLSNSTTLLNINSSDIQIGEPIIIAGTFIPPVGIELLANASIYILDSAGSTNIVAQSSATQATHINPLQIGISCTTINLPLGEVTIILSVEQNGTVIGTAVRSALIRSVQTNNRSPKEDVPSQFAVAGRQIITNPPILISRPEGENIQLLLTPTNSDNRISIFYQADNAQNRFALTIKNASTDAILAESSTPAIVNGISYYPQTHNVGIVDASVGSSNLKLDIAPLSFVSQQNSRLYISDSYVLVNWSKTSITNTSITLQTPYCNETFKLLINGNREGYIPSNYSLATSVSNSSGILTFNGISILPNQYFSVITEGSNNFNPYTNIVYSSRY